MTLFIILLTRETGLLRDLSKYDGSVDETGKLKPIYVALADLVFDVSASRQFYGPGGPYACFAGRDATEGLAKGRLPEYNSEEADSGNRAKAEGKANRVALSDSEIKTLQRWQEKFTEKYQIVALLVKPGQ
jgi:Cytochrome b5-like Heme/Steroid binding domain.